MAGRIPQSFINELLARVDVVEVIDRRVSLKKAGRNYTACCPFHNEKTPSFSVNPDKQFYYCFGCGASGNALTFLMEYEGQEFVAAIEDLAAQQGLEVPRETTGADFQPTNNHLFPLMEKVAHHYQKQLKTHPKAKRAIAYLKNRGLSGEIAKAYGIGFVPDEWQNLLHLDSDQEKLIDDLVATGMMIKKDDGRAYDRFRDRIMFPIRNRRGQVLGFGGRVIDKGEPKYLNSPETELFHKGRELYGLFEMRRQLRNIDHVIIVEGYMDVVALAQFGIFNAAATLGTATTSDHLQTLFRLCPRVVFCFDGDKAGRAAALRALKHALPLVRETREVRMIFLPDGEDPDSLVRKIGAEAFKEQVNQATTLFDYLIDYLTAQVDMNTFEGPARMVHLAIPFLQDIQDPILSARFTARLAELSGLNQEQLAQIISQNSQDSPNSRQQTSSARPPNKSDHSKEPAGQSAAVHPNSASESQYQGQRSRKIDERVTNQSGISDSQTSTASLGPPNQPQATFRRAIALLLQFPDALPAADMEWLKAIADPGAKILLQLVELLRANEEATTAMLIESWRDQPEFDSLNQLATMELYTELDTASVELCEIVKRLEKTYVIEQWDALIEKSKTALLNEAEKAALKRLQQAMLKS